MAVDFVLSVYWILKINGVELDIERRKCVNSIAITNNCDGSDVLTVTISDKEMKFIEDNIFIEDASISAQLIFTGKGVIKSFSGYISTIDIDFPDDGIPTMTLNCIDKSHVMNRTKKSRSWSKVTKAQVVQKIAKEYGFKCIVQSGYSGKKEDTISQSSQTDIEFCEDLASQEDGELYMCKLRGNVLYYVKKGLLSAPKMTVHYRQFPFEVVSFSPRINKETMENTSTSSDVSTDTKKTDTATSKGTNGTQGNKVKTTSNPSSSASGGHTYNASTQKWS